MSVELNHTGNKTQYWKNAVINCRTSLIVQVTDGCGTMKNFPFYLQTKEDFYVAEIKTLPEHWLPKLKFFHINTDPLLYKVNIFNLFAWFEYTNHNILWFPFKQISFFRKNYAPTT